MRVLVLGGTRYVGKRLVHLLADLGHDVTVGSRGKARVTLPSSVQRITLNRTDRDSLRTSLGDIAWDIVYDQLCYSADDAAVAIEIFSGKTGRYILCSSAAVYENPADATEETFDPQQYLIPPGERSRTSYAEGKRLSEAVLFQHAGFPVVAVRFPIILGPDDYTQRLEVQMQRIAKSEPVNVLNPDAEISLISSSEAAAFLAWLSGVAHLGPFNACSDGPISLKTVVRFIEEATGRAAIVNHQLDSDPFSLFGKAVTSTINTGKARRCGFEFQKTRDWLQDLVGIMGTDHSIP